MNCIKCGYELRENAKFCDSCGTPQLIANSARGLRELTDEDAKYFSNEKSREKSSVHIKGFKIGRSLYLGPNCPSVVIEDCVFTATKDLKLSMCFIDYVTIQNCTFSGDFKNSFELEYCSNVKIINCQFEDFKVPVWHVEKVKSMEISKCQFRNCSVSGAGFIEGCIIDGYVSYEDDVNYCIRDSVFEKCIVTGAKDSKYQSVISGAVTSVYDCRFKDCYRLYKSKGELIRNENFLFSSIRMKDAMNIEMENSAKFCDKHFPYL